MRDLDHYPKVFLQTGDCFLGVQPTLVATVLGSCVAVTMCSPERGIGAICHAFLPDSARFSARPSDPQVCRFVDTALESMLSSLMRLKVSPEQLVVKVFGGASGIMSGDRCNLYDIGGRNLQAVRLRLAEHGIRVTRSATGGCQGRKLLFLTHTGDAWVKLLHKSNGGNQT
ncbi:MAG: chemotaxis protein CheD [Humidesulfovibrio sp.]|nr:chemotaxis protein CheD [Desulfovibrio sp.]MDO9082413.1 chemotaxis protein CheD [Humidesulfovibrio sp.]